MTNEKEITPEQSLCLSCGLCCDGTIFGRVVLKDNDSLNALQSGLVQIESKGTTQFFRLPCASYRESSCQIYQERPTNCRNFRCEMLEKYEAGSVSWEDAQRKIGRARNLREQLKTSLGRILPGAGEMSTAGVLKLAPTTQELRDNPTLLKKWAPTLLNMSALLDCLKTHFEPHKKK
jgi:hypothetical protein